jgi:hypothetical protein
MKAASLMYGGLEILISVMTIRFHLQTPSVTRKTTTTSTTTTTTTTMTTMAQTTTMMATSILIAALSTTDNIIPRQLAIPQLLTVILIMVPMHRQKSYINNVLPKSIYAWHCIPQK